MTSSIGAARCGPTAPSHPSGTRPSNPYASGDRHETDLSCAPDAARPARRRARSWRWHSRMSENLASSCRRTKHFEDPDTLVMPGPYPRVGSQASLCLARQILARRSAPEVGRPSEQGRDGQGFRDQTPGLAYLRAPSRDRFARAPEQSDNSRAPHGPLLLRRQSGSTSRTSGSGYLRQARRAVWRGRDCWFGTIGATPTDTATAARPPRRCSTPAAPT
jgi:hypothetical protein